MAHKLECLNRRDRYMIGDWVLCNGKPYQWKRDDYNRTRLGMVSIDDMLITEEILLSHEFRKDGATFVRRVGDALIKIRLDRFQRLEIVKGENSSMNTDSACFMFQLQHILRDFGLTNIADAFEIK